MLPWAYAIARRLVIDVSRRRDREDLRVDPVQDAEEPSGAAAPDDALHRKRSEAALRRDLLYLPPALRDAFELLKVEGLSVAESAKALGITRGMVKIRAYRATVALRSAALRRERVTPKAFASTTCSRGGCRPGSTSPARMTARSGARSGANGEKLELVVTRQPQRICRSSDCHRRPYCQGSAPSGP